MERTDKNIVKKALPLRPDNANKGTMGTLLSVCGSYGMAGAAYLASKAALRCGVGLNVCALPERIYPILAAQLPESVYIPLSDNRGFISAAETDRLIERSLAVSAVLIGCGLGLSDDTKALVYSFLEKCEVPMVLDADALNAVAGNSRILLRAKAPVIITPHPGEMARLISSTAAHVNENRSQTALSFAEKYGVITVLKGAGTIIASPSGRVLLNTTGNSGMATGGSGDVLAGMTASLLAQGAQPFEAAAAAVYLHGLAGDIAAESVGKIPLLPSDIIESLPKAFSQVL